MVLVVDTPIDPNHELLRVAKTWSPDFYEKLRIFEDDNVDESYKAILMGLLARYEKNGENDVIERIKRSEAHMKQKEKDDSSKQAEEESDPGHELFLKHLKAHDRSHRLECKKECDLDLESRREVNTALNGVHEKIPDKQDPRMLTTGFKRKHGLSDQMAFENVSSVNNLKKQSRRNSAGKTKVRVELPNQMPCLENRREFDPQPASAKNTKTLTPIKVRNEAKKVKIESFSAEEHCEVKAAKCFMTHGNDESDSDVVILDEAMCVREGIFNHLVPSKRFDKSMEEDVILHIGGSSESDVFRKEVLDVLRKPYDSEEYTRLTKEVREGHYLKQIPDFGKRLKLKRYRYNRRRRLAILRGFFFWLQNITREGSFKPWKDGACCAVEPPYP